MANVIFFHFACYHFHRKNRTTFSHFISVFALFSSVSRMSAIQLSASIIWHSRTARHSVRSVVGWTWSFPRAPPLKLLLRVHGNICQSSLRAHVGVVKVNAFAVVEPIDQTTWQRVNVCVCAVLGRNQMKCISIKFSICAAHSCECCEYSNCLNRLVAQMNWIKCTAAIRQLHRIVMASTSHSQVEARSIRMANGLLSTYSKRSSPSVVHLQTANAMTACAKCHEIMKVLSSIVPSMDRSTASHEFICRHSCGDAEKSEICDSSYSANRWVCAIVYPGLWANGWTDTHMFCRRMVYSTQCAQHLANKPLMAHSKQQHATRFAWKKERKMKPFSGVFSHILGIFHVQIYDVNSDKKWLYVCATNDDIVNRQKRRDAGPKAQHSDRARVGASKGWRCISVEFRERALHCEGSFFEIGETANKTWTFHLYSRFCWQRQMK